MWNFPIKDSCPGIPVNYHPGAFGFRGKHEHHSGVDLYCKEETKVYACEEGIVICVEPFTGPKDGSPWWRDTDCVLVESKDAYNGIICYGEIKPIVKVGDIVTTETVIGIVEPVLLEGKERPDIPGHSRWMLHLEWYKKGRNKASTPWYLDMDQPDYLLDPTNMLLWNNEGFKKLPEWEAMVKT